MATINDLGNVIARCSVCDGAVSTFVWFGPPTEFGAIALRNGGSTRHFRLFRCGGCQGGASGIVEVWGTHYPGDMRVLVAFASESKERLALPAHTPPGFAAEFEEGEQCLDAGCYRAAASMFRSVRDKTLRSNGYRTKRGTNLEQQIDIAADDGAITVSRQKRAHDDIRVLGMMYCTKSGKRCQGGSFSGATLSARPQRLLLR